MSGLVESDFQHYLLMVDKVNVWLIFLIVRHRDGVINKVV